jgi:hypothetical protein
MVVSGPSHAAAALSPVTVDRRLEWAPELCYTQCVCQLLYRLNPVISVYTRKYLCLVACNAVLSGGRFRRAPCFLLMGRKCL